ncbi:hypothetical protein O2K51_07735 [Apibacter raozihei]|uniref:hypothetical protein n=1 Tax=Apibacter raozihei TaxID=2500547 RepID=UPI000FE2FFB1|nr:hypothetical protein [Apibacter raozihei]
MEYKEVIREVIILAFEKARKESLQNLKTPLSKYLSFKIENLYKIYVSEKTFVRYYDKFIDGRDNATGIPNRRIIDFICKYLGYDNVIDFYSKKHKRITELNQREVKAGFSGFNKPLHDDTLFFQKKKDQSNRMKNNKYSSFSHNR